MAKVISLYTCDGTTKSKDTLHLVVIRRDDGRFDVRDHEGTTSGGLTFREATQLAARWAGIMDLQQVPNRQLRAA